MQKIPDSNQKDSRKKLITEIRVMSQVDIPHVIKLFGVDSRNGETLIFMGASLLYLDGICNTCVAELMKASLDKVISTCISSWHTMLCV